MWFLVKRLWNKKPAVLNQDKPNLKKKKSDGRGACKNTETLIDRTSQDHFCSMNLICSFQTVNHFNTETLVNHTLLRTVSCLWCWPFVWERSTKFPGCGCCWVNDHHWRQSERLTSVGPRTSDVHPTAETPISLDRSVLQCWVLGGVNSPPEPGYPQGLNSDARQYSRCTKTTNSPLSVGNALRGWRGGVTTGREFPTCLEPPGETRNHKQKAFAARKGILEALFAYFNRWMILQYPFPALEVFLTVERERERERITPSRTEVSDAALYCGITQISFSHSESSLTVDTG